MTASLEERFCPHVASRIRFCPLEWCGAPGPLPSCNRSIHAVCMQLSKCPEIDPHSSYQPWLGTRNSTEFVPLTDWFSRSLPIRRFQNERQWPDIDTNVRGRRGAHVVAHRSIELGEELNHRIGGQWDVNDGEQPGRREE